jgi:hypothetical protein
MAKTPSGLPENFDLSVSASDLAGPASLPGYLDEDPVVSFAMLQREHAQQSKTEAKALAQVFQQVPAVEEKITQTVATVTQIPQHIPEPPRPVSAPVAAASSERKRFQINLDVDSERMLEELLDLLSSQSSENRIKTSELFQALLMTLYNAKGEITLGSLPTRGRWGSATAKAFPVNLAESLREAIVNHEQASGGNPFRKVVGA